MIGYEDLCRIQKQTKVYVLTAPDKHERFLFYNDYMSKKHNPLIARQIPVNGYWKRTEGLHSNQLALQSGAICTTAEKGNLKFREYIDKGYTKTISDLYNLDEKI